MAKPGPEAGERYTATQVLEFIHDEQYTIVNDSDQGPEGNESDESSPPTSQEECEKSPDTHERSSPNVIPPSPYSRSPAN